MYFEEKAKKIPVLDEVDVLVAGGGPAGMSAAIASARTGAKTMLVERYGCLGGVLTQVGIGAFLWYRSEKTVEAGGIAKDMEKAAIEMDSAVQNPGWPFPMFKTEMFKCVADHMVTEAGAEPLFHCFVSDAIVEDGQIKGVIIEGKSGRQAIFAKRVIDCTGDGDVAALAGAPFTKREHLSWVTPGFTCSGIHKKEFMDYIKNDLKPTYGDWCGEWEANIKGVSRDSYSSFLAKPFEQAIADGYIDREENIAYGGSFGIPTEDGEIAPLNLIFMNEVDQTDARSLSKAEIDGRRATLTAIKAMRKYVPGFEDARLRCMGMTMGTRECRQIVGDYKLTIEDVENEARFEDSIGIFPEFIDGNGILWMPTTGRYWQIPLRALTPQKIENLLVAGRAISGDINAHASFRNMSCCVVTGQGAGVAAAISAKSGVCVRNVDIKAVQAELERQGVRVF